MATAAALMVIAMVCADEVPAPFVAVRLGEKLPVTVGVPEITPVDVFKETPAGREPPARVHNVGALVTLGVKLKATLIVPVAVCPEAMTGTAALVIVIEIDCAAEVPPALVAVKLGVKTPVTVGVPERTPVVMLKVTPVGSVPLDSVHDVGLLLAATV